MKRISKVFTAAASAALIAGLITAPPAAAAETAMLSGTVTALDSDAPVANATVTLFDPRHGFEWARVNTGVDGRYQVNGMPEFAQVKIRVQAPGFVEQWFDDMPDARNARLVTMRADQPAVADFALRTEAGSIEGRVLDPEGRDAANVRVILRLASGSWSINGYTGTDGRYRFDRIPPGVYEVVLVRSDLATQIFTDIEIQADQTTVRDFAFTTRHSPPPPTGRISGRITDGPGGPGVPGAEVVLFDQPLSVMARTTTDPTGAYAIDNIPMERSFRVRASAPGFAEVWAPEGPDFLNAREFQLLSSEMRVDVPLRRGSGTIRGRITDPAGAGVRATLGLHRPNVSSGWVAYTRVDGTFELSNIPAGSYQVSVTTVGLGRQWARGREQQTDADLIPVADQGTTELNEQFRPRGILEVVLVDAATGAPVSTNCVYVHALAWNGRDLCTGTSGVYRFTDVPPGSVSVHVSKDAAHLGTYVEDGVTVHSAQTTRITLRLRPAGMITTTVRRAADGSIPRTCAYAVPVGLARPYPGDGWNGGCNTDAQGNAIETLTIGPVATEPMQIFVTGDRDKGYGAQWLGATGGTGDRRLAAVVTPRQGQTVSAPQIKLDPAGSISGVVRDQSSGKPILGAYVRPFGIVTGLQMECSNLPHYTACTDQYGQYRLDGLGPYSWPVEFAADGHANQWSGGATNRFDATLVPVKPGQSTRLDASLGVEAKFTNFNRGTNPAEHWSVVAYHAVTGDMISTAWYGDPTLGGLSAGPVVLHYTPYDTNESCWYANGSGTPEHPRRPTVPTVVTVSTGQTIDGLSLIPGSTCFATPTSRPPTPRRPDAGLMPSELTPAGAGTTNAPGSRQPAAQPEQPPVAGPGGEPAGAHAAPTVAERRAAARLEWWCGTPRLGIIAYC